MYSNVTIVGTISSSIEMMYIDGKAQCTTLLSVNVDKKNTELFKVVAKDQTANFMERFFWPGKTIGVNGILSKGKHFGLNAPEEVVILANDVFFTDTNKKEEQNKQ